MLYIFGLFLIMLIFGFVLWILFDSFYWFFKTPKGFYNPVRFKPYGTLYKLLVEFPQQLGKDMARVDSNCFNAQGLIVFEGKQGAGKTISMIHYANLLKARFPECKVLSNTDLVFADGDLNNWQNLIDFDNGIFGVCALIDECQLWANCRAWKNKNNAFNWDMIQEICFNRKHRRCILATTQAFSMLDKNIRINTTEIRRPYTFFHCLTLVFCSVPEVDSDGVLLHKRFKRLYWFVQTDFLRSTYDTFATIKALNNFGFLPESELK